MANYKEMENMPPKEAHNIKGSFMMEFKVVMVNNNTKTNQFMKESGLRISKTVMENTLGLMDLITKATLKMMNLKVKEYIDGQMGKFIMVIHKFLKYRPIQGRKNAWKGHILMARWS